MTGRDGEVRTQEGGDPRVRRILLVAAMARETAAVRRMLARRGRSQPAPTWAAGASSWRVERGAGSRVATEVVVAHCGVGPESVRAWLQSLGASRDPGLEILIVGYAGALDPTLGAGAVVWPALGGAVTLGEASVQVEDRWGPREQESAADPRGSLWTASRPLLEPAEKHRLWVELGRPPSALVDMETAEIMAGLRGLGDTEQLGHTGHTADGVTVCRVVTDAAEERLPGVISHVRTDGSIAPARLLIEILRRPSTLVALVRLALRARTGSARLAAEVETWLAAR